jgi:hypothetical protein
MTLSAPAMTNTIDEILEQQVGYCDARVVDLGVTRVLIRTNVPNFSGFRYFSRMRPAQPGERAPYELYCIDLDHEHSLDEAVVASYADTSFRGKRFTGGFYLTYHFGAPASLITRGNRHYIAGRNLDRIIWGWYTKYILTVHSFSAGSLHLKAACFAVDGEGTLLVARGSGGKTVLLAQVCQDGATFISNTHSIVDRERIAHGVPTTLRVREDACFGPLVRSRKLQPHLDQDEYIADPALLFPRSGSSARVRNVCIVDYRPEAGSAITTLSSAAAYDMFEQFGFPINTYGMKDDVLEFCHGDAAEFLAVYGNAKQQLRELVNGAHCLYVNADMLNPKERARLMKALRH